ncbi:MAG TPA: M4 family metallopeptidase [Verrucomicrobiae bacterium]|nr:M4 family metallopeptidase [Verrucomicrobiae bacterium]
MRRVTVEKDPRPTARTIVPPHVFAHMATLSDAHFPGLAERGRESLVFCDEIRSERLSLRGVTPLTTTSGEGKRRTIYDAEHGFGLPGRPVREEQDGPTADLGVNEAFDGLGATYDYYFEVHGRDSIDARGLPLDATVHYRRSFNNAFWNGRQMVFGDGDGEIFNRFTSSLDIIGHELTHGVTQYEAALDYQGQSGALNEHMSDVFGSLVKQHVLRQTAKRADWLIGEGIWAKGIRGKGLRSMKAPGTAYDDPRVGHDPQPSHMSGYVETDDDNGGVHINSGIPNHAFYLAAIGFGGSAWVKAGKVWYLALTQSLHRDADFMVAAAATVDAAGRQFGTKGASVVRSAWKQVGIEVQSASPRKTALEQSRAKVKGAVQRANSRGPERRTRRAS